MYAIGALNKYIKNGDISNAMIEPTETYFVVYVIIAQTRAITAPTIQSRASIVPTPDATDFPPLNPRKQDLLLQQQQQLLELIPKTHPQRQKLLLTQQAMHL